MGVHQTMALIGDAKQATSEGNSGRVEIEPAAMWPCQTMQDLYMIHNFVTQNKSGHA